MTDAPVHSSPASGYEILHKSPSKGTLLGGIGGESGHKGTHSCNVPWDGE
jgi:hypothetical protein